MKHSPPKCAFPGEFELPRGSHAILTCFQPLGWHISSTQMKMQRVVVDRQFSCLFDSFCLTNWGFVQHHPLPGDCTKMPKRPTKRLAPPDRIILVFAFLMKPSRLNNTFSNKAHLRACRMTLLSSFVLLSDVEMGSNDTSEKSGMFNRHSKPNQTPPKQEIHNARLERWTRFGTDCRTLLSFVPNGFCFRTCF